MTQFSRHDRFTFEAVEPRLMMASDTLRLPGVEMLAAHDAITQFSNSSDPQTQLAGEDALTGLDQARQAYGFTGDGQTVVVIDSGIAYDHQALGGGFGAGYQVVGGWDFTEENDANPYDDGPLGAHGTHVAGIIGSRDVTYSGVAPGVDLVALRVFNDQGDGRFTWVENALNWVHENRNAFENPITTVNLSIGTNVNADTVPDWAILEEEFAQLEADGIFISVAAGNGFQSQSGPGLSYPAVSSHVVPVAAVDGNGQISDFSQRNSRVIAAPGRSIWSTVPDYVGNLNGRQDDFAALSGTSMAAPYVAGASVLLREALQLVGTTGVTQQTIYGWMQSTADSVFDPLTGQSYRRLNVARALDAILPADDYGSSADSAFGLGTIDARASFDGLVGRLDDTDYFRFTAGQSGTITLKVDANYKLDPDWDLSQIAGAEQDLEASTIRFDVTGGQSYTIGLGTNDGLGYYQVDVALEPVAETIDWGVVEASRFDDVTLSTLGQSFLLTSRRSGILTVEAMFDTSVGAVQLELYDTTGNLVAVSDTTDGGARFDVQAEAGRQFELRATGSGVEVDFRATNLVTTVGSLVVVRGTAGDDVFEFAAGDVHHLTVVGVDYAFDGSQFRAFQFSGGAGSDRIELVGGAGSSQARLRSGWSQLRGDDYLVSAAGIEAVEVQAGEGSSQAVLYDSPGDDSLIARPDSVVLTGAGFTLSAQGFKQVRANSTRGNDRARIDDSLGDDLLVARGDTIRMKSGWTENIVVGFDRVTVFADQGNDTALIYHVTSDGKTTTPSLSMLGFDTYSHRFVTLTPPSTGQATVAVAHGRGSINQTNQAAAATPAAARGSGSAALLTADSDPGKVRAALHDATLERVSTAWTDAASRSEPLTDANWSLGLSEIWRRWTDDGSSSADAAYDYFDRLGHEV